MILLPKFTVQLNDSAEVSIPSLTNWKYYFSLTATNKDEKGQVFGIDHSKFEKLNDENGKLIPVENTYHVYNAFIDFHSMSVFSEKTSTGNGAQNLKHNWRLIILCFLLTAASKPWKLNCRGVLI